MNESGGGRGGEECRSCRLAVVCMVPDVGHVLPLLKLAEQVRDSCEIAAFVPEELVGVVSSFGFRATSLGAVRPDAGLPSLRRYVAASEVRRILRAYPESRRDYVQPLMERIGRAVPRLSEGLATFRPHSILADDHVQAFGRLRKLLPTFGAATLFHSADSVFTQAHNTWSLESCYWDDWRSAARDARRKTANELRLVARGWRPPPRPAIEDVPADPPPALQSGPRSVHRLSSGTSALERALLGPRLLPCPEGRVIVASPPPLETQLSPELRAWLGQPDGAVAYVSFGTMAVPPTEIVRRIVEAVLARGVRVLLQHAEALPPRRGLRQEAWVGQTAVLAHDAVRLFVTHAGAGSVQEALWFGKPMVCLPAAWDHYYDAWVVSLLGAGVTLPHNRSVRAGRLAAAVRRGMRDEHARQARAVAGLMRRQWDAQRDFVRDLLLRRGAFGRARDKEHAPKA